MNKKNAGWLMFAIITLHVAFTLIALSIPGFTKNLSGALNLLLGQLLMLVPGVICLIIVYLKDKEKISDIIGLKKIKTGTVFLMIVYGLLCIPITLFFNLLSTLFTTNVIMENTDKIFAYSPAAVILCVGILGPISEELVCRGLIFRGLKKDMAPIIAMILSGITFGIFHMNLNQFIYAAVLGIFLALAVYATGSILSSIIIHMVLNTDQVIKLLVVNSIMPEMYSSNPLDEISTSQYMMILIVYMFIAGVCGALVVGVSIWAAHHEGRLDILKNIFKGNKEKVITLPYAISAILGIAIIIITSLGLI
ncbi:MAG: CPBP family intramembrane metalloprotease [Lachnospiraceae bacterium]|nr:CPBP family intramembrane metalloprotease [Lachnospiraceae bacterium]